jgi:hypothetical protein
MLDNAEETLMRSMVPDAPAGQTKPLESADLLQTCRGHHFFRAQYGNFWLPARQAPDEPDFIGLSGSPEAAASKSACGLRAPIGSN